MSTPESTTDRIAITELADELKCHKQTLFKIAKRLGIEPAKERSEDRRNQLVSTVTGAEADTLRRELLTRTSLDCSESESELFAGNGLFYMIQLEPEHDPGRLKLGFTTDIDGRLRKHRCSAPFAICLKVWPCKMIWERTAIDCITAGLEQLHTEVFRANSLDAVKERADQFFAMMPSVSNREDDIA